jgi:hypothetical protein
VTEPKGGIVLANNAELGTLDSATVIGNIVKSNRLDNSNGIWLNGADGGGNTTYFGNVNVVGNQVCRRSCVFFCFFLKLYVW